MFDKRNINSHLHVFVFALVLQCKLIVCQMSNTRCQALSWLLLPMLAVVLLAVTGVVANETLLLYLWTAAVILAHIHYGVSVVRAHIEIINFPLIHEGLFLWVHYELRNNALL